MFYMIFAKNYNIWYNLLNILMKIFLKGEIMICSAQDVVTLETVSNTFGRLSVAVLNCYPTAAGPAIPRG